MEIFVKRTVTGPTQSSQSLFSLLGTILLNSSPSSTFPDIFSIHATLTFHSKDLAKVSVKFFFSPLFHCIVLIFDFHFSLSIVRVKPRSRVSRKSCDSPSFSLTDGVRPLLLAASFSPFFFLLLLLLLLLLLGAASVCSSLIRLAPGTQVYSKILFLIKMTMIMMKRPGTNSSGTNKSLQPHCLHCALLFMVNDHHGNEALDDDDQPVP